MKTLHHCLRAAGLLALAGCADQPRPELKMALPERVALDVGIPREQIRESGACQYARVPPGVLATHFYRCWYAATDSALKLLDWDDKRMRLVVAVSQDYAALRGVAAATWVFNWQLQLQGPNTWLVMYNDRAAPGAGSLKALQQRLLAAGVQPVDSPGFVNGSEVVPQPMVIPIYIPASR